MALETKAISEEQKALRKNAIIQSARELFEKYDFHEINMQNIARRAGMAKGTVFFYFKTKEELFLAYAQEELNKWHDRFDALLHDYKNTHDSSSYSVDELVDLMVQSLGKDGTFIRILSIMGNILVHNIDYDVMYAHKKLVLKRALPLGKLLEEIIPGFKPFDGIKLYHYAFFIVSGLYPMSEPSKTVKRVFKKPGMEFFDFDFIETFREMMGIILRGWK